MLSVQDEIIGQGQGAQFRYSKDRFRTNLAIAIGLTALVCGLIWLLLGIYGSPHMNTWTIVAGLVFFAFISARMIAQYFRDEVVLAIQPTGLYDGRLGQEIIEWEIIKELVLSRREHEFTLAVYLWPKTSGKSGSKNDTQKVDYLIDLSPLDAIPEKILETINQYKSIRLER